MAARFDAGAEGQAAEVRRPAHVLRDARSGDGRAGLDGGASNGCLRLLNGCLCLLNGCLCLLNGCLC